MQYDVDVGLFDHRAKPIRMNPASETAATLRDVLELVCLAPNDVVKTADEKLKVYRILQKVMAAAPFLEIEAKDVDLLKRIIGAIYPSALVGPLYDALEKPVG